MVSFALLRLPPISAILRQIASDAGVARRSSGDPDRFSSSNVAKPHHRGAYGSSSLSQ
jgi:hypothetical protein